MAANDHTADSPLTGEHVEVVDEVGRREESAPAIDEFGHGRTPEAGRTALLAQNAVLRTANENLVVATLDAQTLRAESEATNQRQNEFLAMLAHELRNPLAPISMASSLLARMPDQPPQLSYIQQIIQRQVSHLSRLLDDLLDAARINSGKISLTRSPVVLADILLSAIETVELRISERQQLLEIDIPSTDIILIGDPIRLVQVFSNLLINASKFTQDGGKIMLTVLVTGIEVVIKVTDNGAGISPQVLPHIFALFTQGPRSLARSEGGLGIGLNIVRNIVELHGGTVAALSAGEGQGSIFAITLPLPVLAPRPLPTAPAQTDVSHDFRILIVEDNVDACNTLSMFLQLEGFTTVTAYDGLAGLATGISGHFDVLICDIGLPGMDGYELLQRLRNALGNKMPLTVALSGYGQIEDRARAMAAGFDQYLVKPVNISELLNLISAPAGNKAEHGC